MSRDAEKIRLFTRRAVLVGGLKAGLFSLLAGRLYYLQILQSERLRTMAEGNRINLRLIAPPRGQILDRSGAPLALDQKNYRLILLPDRTEDPEATLVKISAFVDLTDMNKERIAGDLKKAKGAQPVLIRDNLTWEQVSAISLRMPEIPGADIEVGDVRAYPYGEATAHAVGYVGLVSAEDKEVFPSGANIPGFRVGKSGIEKQNDSTLRGVPGDLQLEVNAHGRVVRELARRPPKPGQDLRLTLDIGLQQAVAKRLEGEESASAVVMDALTGAVYALVSHPGYDPNLFTYGISQQDWNRLSNNPRHLLLNKVLDGTYAPGSTFKIVTALAALDAGVCDPTDRVYCAGHMELGNHKFHCWKKGGHGPVNLLEAMAGSCDVYFYEMSKRVGVDRLQAMAKRLGLSAPTGIDMPHEKAGLIPSRVWKTATYGTPWTLGETLISGIGQGYVLATPMQLAVMMARVANGGRAVTPHLALREEDGRHRFDSLGIDRRHLDIVMEALSAVVNSPLGTAHAARAEDPSLTMAGKTGTSQVRRITTAERADGVLSNDELPWKERDHALFVGAAPADRPRYVACVVVEHGGSGAHTAAPIVRDILVECQKRNPRG